MSGQITLASEFGRQLRNLASQDKYKRFVEIGTWNGAGSTLCLVNGFFLRDSREGARIVSLEANERMYYIAKDFYKDCPEFLTLIYGKLSRKMMEKEEILKHPLFNKIKEHYHLFYEQDCLDFKNSYNILLSGNIDVAVLDGGEFSSESDLKAILKMNPKVICLDDVNVVKNYNNYCMLKEDPNWRIMIEGSERNGFAIFERITPYEFTDGANHFL